MTGYNTRNETRQFTMSLYCAECARTTPKAHYKPGSGKVHCKECAKGGIVARLVEGLTRLVKGML